MKAQKILCLGGIMLLMEIVACNNTDNATKSPSTEKYGTVRQQIDSSNTLVPDTLPSDTTHMKH